MAADNSGPPARHKRLTVQATRSLHAGIWLAVARRMRVARDT